ncbi:MAG: capsule assembly Wzi family protein [Syntrophotaleaceae bacterium]
MKGARPYTRIEAARQVREAKAKLHSAAPPLVALELVDRLQAFLDDEMGNGAGGGSYLKPLRELRLDYMFQSGADATVASRAPGSSTDLVDARQFALNYNNYGIDYSEHHNAQLLFESEARLGEYLLLSARPLFEFQQDGAVGSLHLLHGKAALGLGPLELSVGRQSLWWGQGRHGSLVLTNNAKPLDMLRITNPSPVLLPWIFKYLGPFRFDVFWSELEKERVVPEPYFSGLRLQFKPLPWFEIGASRAVMFGGEGLPDIGLDEFITILGGKNLEGGEDTSNSVAALDARLRLPFLWGAEVYGEYGGEDEAGHFLANDAWLAGLLLPRIEPSGRLSLRLEYADLSKIDNNSPPWYRHGTFRSGYTYEGKVLGHHAGGAAKDVSGELQMLLPKGVTVTVGVDYEQRGFDQEVKEKHNQGTLKADWAVNRTLALSIRYGIDKIDNFEFESGNDKTHHMAMVGLHGSW